MAFSKGRVPQDMQSLDAKVTTMDNGHSTLWIGEFFQGTDSWRAGSRAFYLPVTTTKDREFAAKFIRYISERYIEFCEAVPASDPVTVAATEARSGFSEYLANTRNGPVKVTPAPAKVPTNGTGSAADTLRAQLSK